MSYPTARLITTKEMRNKMKKISYNVAFKLNGLVMFKVVEAKDYYRFSLDYEVISKEMI
jgi:hypothetical protein